MSKQIIATTSAPAAIGSYSQAVKAGDTVETEIEGVCCLTNTIVDDHTYFARTA